MFKVIFDSNEFVASLVCWLFLVVNFTTSDIKQSPWLGVPVEFFLD